MTSYRVNINTLKFSTGESIIKDRIYISRPIAFFPYSQDTPSTQGRIGKCIRFKQKMSKRDNMFLTRMS